MQSDDRKSNNSGAWLHIDVFSNDWHNNCQRRLARISGTNDYWLEPTRWNLPGGTYFDHTPEPHSDEDCPFKDSDVLPFKKVTT